MGTAVPSRRLACGSWRHLEQLPWPKLSLAMCSGRREMESFGYYECAQKPSEQAGAIKKGLECADPVPFKKYSLRPTKNGTFFHVVRPEAGRSVQTPLLAKHKRSFGKGPVLASGSKRPHFSVGPTSTAVRLFLMSASIFPA